MTSTGAVIFDLDGTLTVPVLDFDAIRTEIGIDSGPILEAIAQMQAPERERAEAILTAHESVAAHTATLQPGAAECIAALRASGWPVGILTRNTTRWTRTIIERFAIKIDALRTRDDGVIKPSPEPLYDLCAVLDRDVTKSWMIGDHWFDIETGRRAGCKTMLMIGDRNPPSYAHHADYIVRDLGDVMAHVHQPIGERGLR